MQIFIIIGLNKVTAFLNGFKIIDVNCWGKLYSPPLKGEFGQNMLFMLHPPDPIQREN
jgi:hypothetical protein